MPGNDLKHFKQPSFAAWPKKHNLRTARRLHATHNNAQRTTVYDGDETDVFVHSLTPVQYHLVHRQGVEGKN